MTNHTLGPWFYDTVNNEIQCQHGFLGDPEKETVCTIESSLSPDKVKANAQLIAAAPEMLEALKRVSKECAETPGELSEAALGIIQMECQAVINKAEGRN